MKEPCNTPQKSIPWSRDEMVWVNGYGLAYTMTGDLGLTEDDMLVHLPGGRSVPASDLRMRGWRVIMPPHVRRGERFA